jgi:hypothetical protein
MRPSYADAMYLVDTLMPSARDPARAAATVRNDPEILEAMLEDDRLIRRLLDGEQVLLNASPRLFFEVLLRRTRRDMEKEAWTLERRSLQQVVIFDGDRVLELLARPELLDYLASTLASFTRVESTTIPVRVRKGVWRRYRVSDVDVDSLIRFCHVVEPHDRFSWYKRIGDTCLFLTGLFPEYIEAQHRYPLTRQPRPRSRSALCRSREDYEAQGRAFYRLAAEHDDAGVVGEQGVLALLSANFILAGKPLAFMADRYLGFTKHHLFDL